MSLEELVGALHTLLEHAERTPADGRVSELPDARTLRYYQTIGVLDKPLRYDGRRAVYTYRHLLQALNIKMRQAQGYSLAQIQARLANTNREELERLVFSALGDKLELESASDQSNTQTGPRSFSPEPLYRDEGSRALIAVEVGRGVSVLIDPARVDSPEVILAAMTELLNAIR